MFGKEGDCEVFGCGDDGFFRCSGGHFEVVGKPLHGLGDSGATGGGGPDIVAHIMPHSWADIKSLNGMR